MICCIIESLWIFKIKIENDNELLIYLTKIKWTLDVKSVCSDVDYEKNWKSVWKNYEEIISSKYFLPDALWWVNTDEKFWPSSTNIVKTRSGKREDFLRSKWNLNNLEKLIIYLIQFCFQAVLYKTSLV